MAYNWIGLTIIAGKGKLYNDIFMDLMKLVFECQKKVNSESIEDESNFLSLQNVLNTQLIFVEL